VKASTHPLVAVVWDDAKATAVVEYDLNEVRTQFHRPARYTTYGLLLVDDDKGVTLAAEEGDDRNLRGLSFIPRPMIVEVVKLTRPRVRKAREKKQAPAPPAERQTASPARAARHPEAPRGIPAPEEPSPGPAAAPARVVSAPADSAPDARSPETLDASASASGDPTAG
jgi:hypothetical protein